MSRRLVLLVSIAIVVGYAGLAGLGIALVSAKQALDSNTTAIHTLESKINAMSGPAASPAPPRPAPTPVNLATIRPAFIMITDTLGDVWLPNIMTGAWIPVKAGTRVAFTASATSPGGRPLQYLFTTGSSPRLITICDWSPDASCSWVAAQSVISGSQVSVVATVRDDNPADGIDVISMQYNVGPASG